MDLSIKLIFILLFFNNVVQSKHTCPRQCECDIFAGSKRATCVMHNIVDVSLEVPYNVQIFDLSHNSIHKIEDFSFRGMGYKSLVELNLSYNMIFWIGLHAFADLDNLIMLNLKRNRLQSLHSEIFWYNKNLQVLDLSENKFTDYFNQPFLSHVKLMTLYLKNSQISYLSKDAFKNLPNLRYLDLSDNLMIELKIDTFQPMIHLEEIDLSGNQWSCNDMFKSVQLWLQNRNVDFKPQCSKNFGQFEKMINIERVTVEPIEKDLDELWGIEEDMIVKNITEVIPVETYMDKINGRVPAILAFICGVVIGSVLGIFATYIWISDACKCPKIKLQNRRHVRRMRRVQENEARSRLLQNCSMHENIITPPVIRRQMSNPSVSYRSNSFVMRSGTVSENTQGNPPDERSETPPPPYNESFHDVVLSI